jgi:hypothetical protein
MQRILFALVFALLLITPAAIAQEPLPVPVVARSTSSRTASLTLQQRDSQRDALIRPVGHLLG